MSPSLYLTTHTAPPCVHPCPPPPPPRASVANAPNGQRHVRDRGVLMLPPTHAPPLTQFMGKPQSAHFVARARFLSLSPLFVGGIHLVLAGSRDSPSCLDGRYVIKRHWMAVRTGHGILMVKAVIYWQIRGRECWGAEHTHLNPQGLFIWPCIQLIDIP